MPPGVGWGFTPVDVPLETVRDRVAIVVGARRRHAARQVVALLGGLRRDLHPRSRVRQHDDPHVRHRHRAFRVPNLKANLGVGVGREGVTSRGAVSRWVGRRADLRIAHEPGDRQLRHPIVRVAHRTPQRQRRARQHRRAIRRRRDRRHRIAVELREGGVGAAGEQQQRESDEGAHGELRRSPIRP